MMADDWKSHIHERTLADLEARCALLTVVAAPGGRACILFSQNGEDTLGKREIRNPLEPAEWQRAAEEILTLVGLIDQNKEITGAQCEQEAAQPDGSGVSR